MARACALDGGNLRLRVRRQLARGVNVEQADTILLQGRDEQRLVVAADIGRMTAFRAVDHWLGASGTPSAPMGLMLTQASL